MIICLLPSVRLVNFSVAAPGSILKPSQRVWGIRCSRLVRGGAGRLARAKRPATFTCSSVKDVVKAVHTYLPPDQYVEWDVVAYDWNNYDLEIHRVNPLSPFSKTPTFLVVFNSPASSSPPTSVSFPPPSISTLSLARSSRSPTVPASQPCETPGVSGRPSHTVRGRPFSMPAQVCKTTGERGNVRMCETAQSSEMRVREGERGVSEISHSRTIEFFTHSTPIMATSIFSHSSALCSIVSCGSSGSDRTQSRPVKVGFPTFPCFS